MNRGPRSAEARLKQLLVMLPWLMEVGEVPLAEVAERFGVSEAHVTKDLELVAMCGLPPYVDEMIDVFVDDGMVFVGVPRLFTRPLRLTAPEGFALLAAGRAAMELPGADPSGPLARGLDKLADALGEAGLDADARVRSNADDRLGVAVDLDRPPLTDEVTDAAATGGELEIRYFSPSRGEAASRTIVPRHVFAESGRWYVLADDKRSGERRTFRVDRMESAIPTGVSHPVDPDVDAPPAFFIDADLPRARLRLAPQAQWIAEQYPVDSVEPVRGRAARRSPDSVEVVLPVASDWWLDRLLVRLGPHVEVVEPAGAGDGAAHLAERILANYR
jgi:proteasome accessory factor C